MQSWAKIASMVPTWRPRRRARFAELRGLEVVVAIGSQEGEGAEPRDDGLLVARAAEALEELLVDEACRDDELAVRERSFEGADLGRRSGGIAAKREGPDARVHEERQARERSRL